jgi:hypothetical protein
VAGAQRGGRAIGSWWRAAGAGGAIARLPRREVRRSSGGMVLSRPVRR